MAGKFAASKTSYPNFKRHLSLCYALMMPVQNEDNIIESSRLWPAKTSGSALLWTTS